jgi:integrase
MPNGKITLRSIAKLEKTSVTSVLWDVERPGFGIKVTPSGKKVFILQYRLGGRGSKTKRYTIGAFGTYTETTAKREAQRLLLLVSQGIDPAAERQKANRAAMDLGFRKIANEYLADKVMVHIPKSYNFVESAMRLHIMPVFKDRPIGEISEDDVLAVIARIPSKQRALRRNVFAIMSPFFRWAKRERRYIRSNPMADLDPPPTVPSRTRVLSDHEITTVWAGLRGTSAPYDDWARMLMILGQRRTEVAAIDWCELHRPERVWILPAEKAKNGHPLLVPLSDLALEHFDMLAGGDLWPSHGLVFTRTGRTPISAFSQAKEEIDATIARDLRKNGSIDIKPWRFHDFRRTMATTMQKLKVRPEVIEASQNRLAGDSKRGAAKVYQLYDYADEKQVALQSWGEFLRPLIADSKNLIAASSE